MSMGLPFNPLLLAAFARRPQQPDGLLPDGAPGAAPADLPSVRRLLSPPTTIEAGAPDPWLMRPMSGADLIGEQNQDWLQSSDPYKRHAAWSQVAGPGVAYPGDELPEEARAREMRAGGPTQHSGGFLGRLKDAAIMAGAAGPLGFVAGLINPQLAHNFRYRQLELPQVEHQAQLARQQADQRAQQADRYAAMSGINPYTGQPTLAGQYRNYTINAGNRRLDQGDTRLAQGDTRLGIAQEQNDIRRQRLAQQFAHWSNGDFIQAYRDGALNGNPDALRAYADRLGIPGDVPDRFLAGAVKQTVDAGGNYGTQNLQTGETTTTGVKSYKTTEEAGRNTRFQQGEAGRNQRQAISEAEQNRRFVEAERGRNQRARMSRKKLNEVPWYLQNETNYRGDETSEPGLDARRQAFKQQMRRARQSPNWSRLSPAEQQQFVDRLRERLIGGE